MGTLLHLRAGSARAIVDPDRGARLAALSVDGLSLLRTADPSPYGWGCYPMVPWAGRLRGNCVLARGRAHQLPPTFEGWALHGTLVTARWRVEEVTGQDAVLVAPLGEHWPWPGEAWLTWALDEDTLSSELEVRSGGGTFPAACGWHPWFPRRLERGGDVELDVPAEAMLERGPDHLPTGRRISPPPPGPYDDAFHTPGRDAVLTWPGALRLRMTSSCDWTVVFDERSYAVCVEPQTGPPDGLNTCPDVVTPERPLAASMSWHWA